MTAVETSAKPTGIAPAPPDKSAIIDIVGPVDVDRLADVFKKFEDFKRRLLSDTDSVNIQGRQFIKKSGWRKWALACAVSDRIVSIERVPATGRDPETGFYYRVITDAFHVPTGRSASGVAVASSSEKAKWAHEEHDVFTLAATRSKNRAIADLVGGGEVSAEEVELEPETAPAKPSTPKQGSTQSTWKDNSASSKP